MRSSISWASRCIASGWKDPSRSLKLDHNPRAGLPHPRRPGPPSGRGRRTVFARTGPECRLGDVFPAGRVSLTTLRLFGAELHAVPAVPFKNPENYVHQAARLAEELAKTEAHGVLYADQWENLSNGDGHYRSTGPEIWQQTNGTVDAFCCSIGTGGTISGVGRYLKERKPNVVIALTDPLGSCMFNHYKHGELRSEGDSITEGIGQGRITANIAAAPVDEAFQVPDEEALPVIFDLLSEEGLCIGGSTGINVAGAIQLAKQMGPGHTIVTILADFGTRYQSKLFNPVFLREKGLPVPAWLEE